MLGNLTRGTILKDWRVRPGIWEKLAGIFVFACFMLPLVLYCVVGFYTRYAADDYETAGSLNKYGFWGSQRFWYLGWSGRYSYFLIVGLFQLLDVGAAPVLTTMGLVLWMAALWWLFHQLLKREAVRYPAYLAGLGAALILVVTLRSMDHIHQILFWVTGILTYPIYLILLTFFIGWVIFHSLRGWTFHWLEIVGAAVYAFMLTGISEVSAALQGLVACLAVLFFLVWRFDPPKRRSGLLLSGAILLSTLVGLVILFTAPGNAVRAALFPLRPSLYSLVVQSNLNTVLFIANWVKNDTLLGMIAFLLPAMMGFVLFQPPQDVSRLVDRERAALRVLLISLPVVYLVLLSTFATGYYAISDNPPARAQVVPQYFLTIAVVIWGYMSGSLLKGVSNPARTLPVAVKLIGSTLLALMLLYGPLYASAYIYTMIEPARVRAVEWDERDQIIREAIQAGERNVVVWYIRDLNRLGDYSSDPDFKVNQAAADYYGLDTLIALDERP